MAKVKICGLTNLEDAVKAYELKADFLGFIFIKNTPRFVDEKTVRNILFDSDTKLHGKIDSVGLFLDSDIDEVVETVLFSGLNYVQLHGSESPDYCFKLKSKFEEIAAEDLRETANRTGIIKVFKVGDEIITGAYDLKDYEAADFFVFDTFTPVLAGGTGKRFNLEILKKAKITKPFFIAGGLDPSNVKEVVTKMKGLDNFFGVDVSSGVEIKKCRKDENLLKEFIKNAKTAKNS